MKLRSHRKRSVPKGTVQDLRTWRAFPPEWTRRKILKQERMVSRLPTSRNAIRAGTRLNPMLKGTEKEDLDVQVLLEEPLNQDGESGKATRNQIPAAIKVFMF